jgi:hypothetical protein
MKRLILNGHNHRKGYALVLEETGEPVAFRQGRLSKVRALVDRFNRAQERRAETNPRQ